MSHFLKVQEDRGMLDGSKALLVMLRSGSLDKRCLGTASWISLRVTFGGVKGLFNLRVIQRVSSHNGFDMLTLLHIQDHCERTWCGGSS